jgi:transposase InsO family protein
MHTYKKIKEKGYYWNNILNDIRMELQTCIPCQQYTIMKHGYHPYKFTHASIPWDHVLIDLIQFVETPTTSAYCLILIDTFTNFIILRALPDTKGSTIAKELHDIFSLLGPPKILQSDRGSHFLNSIMTAFTHLHQVRHRFAAQYHPQTNGKVERTIGTIRTMLNKIMIGNIMEWPYYLNAVQYYYNNKISELTQSSPFSLLFGRCTNEFIKFDTILSKPITKQQWYNHQQKLLSLIYPILSSKFIHLKQQQVNYYNKLKRNLLLESLPPGMQVAIKNLDYSSKNDIRYLTGYTILKRTLHGPYLLREPSGKVYPRLVPIDQIKPLRRLPLQLANDNQDRWVVSKILDHRDVKIDNQQQRQYKVKWEGWTDSTWEPVSNLDQCTQLIVDYWRSKPTDNP